MDHLVETLIRGKLSGPYQGGEKRNITFGKYTAALRLDRDGKRETWVLTAFGPKDFKGDREAIKKKEALDEHGTCPREYRAYWPHTYGTLRYEECLGLPTPTVNQTTRRNASNEAQTSRRRDGAVLSFAERFC